MSASFGKKSILIVCISLLISVAFASIALGASNGSLARNGHFTELIAPNQLAEWGISLQPSKDSLYSGHVDSDAFDGAPALRLVGADESGRAIAVQRDIPAEGLEGKTLKVSAWYKGNDVVKRDRAENFIRVEFYKREGNGLKSTGGSRAAHAPDGTVDWTLLTNEFTVPDGTELMWISISLREASGEASWAAVELHDITN